MARNSRPLAGDILSNLVQLPVWVPLLGAALIALLIGARAPIVAALAVLPLLFTPYHWVRASANRARLLSRVAAGDVKQNLALLSWPAFLRLVGAIYQQRGYTTVESVKVAPDGGVDHAFRNANGLFFVACKHMPNKQVGAQVVRDLQSVTSAARATGGAVVNVGGFDADAVATAKKFGLELIDGDRLANYLRAKPPALLFTSRVDTAAIAVLGVYLLLIVATVNIDWERWLNSLQPAAPHAASAIGAQAATVVDPAALDLKLARQAQQQRNFAQAAADQARKQLAEDKIVAWSRSFKATNDCVEPANWKTQVECGNEYMRAKKKFDFDWENAHPSEPVTEATADQ